MSANGWLLLGITKIMRIMRARYTVWLLTWIVLRWVVVLLHQLLLWVDVLLCRLLVLLLIWVGLPLLVRVHDYRLLLHICIWLPLRQSLLLFIFAVVDFINYHCNYKERHTGNKN